MDRFTSRVNKFLKEREAMRRQMLLRGPALIKRGIKLMSLRELARRVGVGVAYLSLVKTGKTPLAPAVYVKLSEAIRLELKERKAWMRARKSC